MLTIAEPAGPKGPALLRAEIIDDLAAFTALRTRWNELLPASEANCPFLTWEWLHAWWTHLHGASRLRLVTAYAGDELIAIAPLRTSRSHLGLFPQLEFLGTGYAGSDYLDIIARSDHAVEAVRAVAQSVASQGVALRLKHLPPTSLASHLREHMAAAGWTSQQSAVAVCPFIPLAGHTWESYLSTLGSSHRANFRRRHKALHNRFRVGLERVASEPHRHEALSALMAFHAERWRTRGGSSAFRSPALCRFHDDITRRALERGWLRLYLLRIDDSPAAVMYAFAHNRRFYFYQHGFDPRYQSHSVGLVLMGLTIKSAIEDEGALEFDMLYGNEPYKRLWARHERSLRQIELFPPHLAGTLHQRLVDAGRSARTLIRRLRSMGEAHAS